MWMIDIATEEDVIQMRIYSDSAIEDLREFGSMKDVGAAHETSLWIMVF